ncbi:MobA/MobL family protein [Acidithiobacillus sp. MC6.1]|nr:MobA/MobL family protein [Acidithiobacillus sp. MC6.1]
MAIYHASTKPIARSAGRSAVAAAAYRAGVALVDVRTGLVHDYTRKEGVQHTEILTPGGLGVERNALWDAAEQAEKRKDARTAREWVVALPSELSAEQRTDLARDFAQALVERYGVAVDFAVHAPDREGDNRNHHAHLLTTTRQVSRGPEGGLVFGDKSPIELSDKKRREMDLVAAADEVRAVRELWEHTANTALERAGVEVRIDARSLQAQGIDREASQHLGPVASEMERRGKVSDRGDGNREVQANNARRAALSAEIIDLQAERARVEHEAEAQRQREAVAKAERERQQRDTETAAEQWPGIRHPDKPHWQVYRERVLTDTYSREVGEALGQWVKVERVEHGLRIHNKQMDLTDHGDRVTAGKGGTQQEIDAMLQIARAKGWERLDLTGSREFQERAGAAGLAAGFDLADAELKASILETQGKDRASREKAIAEIMATIDTQKANSFDRRIAALQDAAIPVSDESRRPAGQDALRKWEGKQDKDWLRAARSAGGWNALRKQYQAEYDQASTGLLSWTPARKHEAARLDGQLKQLDSLLAERKRSADAAELALDEKHEAAAQVWARVSPHIDAARERFQERHQVWKANEEACQRGERQRKLLDFAKALRADSDARMDIGPAYRAAGYQLQEQKDGKKAWVYPHDDLRDERLEIKQTRKEWDTRKRERLERERQAAEALAERERREAEAASAAFLEPRPGQDADRQPDWISGAPRKAPSRWQQWRERTLSERYGDDLAGRAAQEDWYIRMRPDLGGLNIQVRTHTGKMEVVDSGDAIRAEQGKADIPLMLDMAGAHGWTTLDITGAEEFRQAAAAAALQAGFDISDKGLERGARQRIEQERKKRQAELAKQQQRRRQPPQRGPGIGDE